MDREFSTPMMQQYMSIKQQYPDCMLFFRLGDFYELFLDDALIGAKVLNIILTRRPRGKDGDIPMAGVPFHAADSYIAKLVKAGYKIAICEQVSDPSLKGLVERDVVRIVTPGTILDEKTLTAKEHNYVMSITLDDDTLGIASADISTGDFQATEIKYRDNLSALISNELSRYLPAECILNNREYNSPVFLKLLTQDKSTNISCFDTYDAHANQAEKMLTAHFKIKNLRGFGLHDKPVASKAAAALLGYLSHTQKNHIGHITSIRTYTPHDHVVLDGSTITNLELFTTIRDHEEHGSFIECIDTTKTAMGGRLLRQWIREPLRNKKQIETRHSVVEALINNSQVRQNVATVLADLYDIERILSRLSVGIGNPHDLINLKQTLFSAQKIYTLLSEVKNTVIEELITQIPDIKPVIDYIENYIVPEPPFDPKHGDLIKRGVDSKLDALHEEIRESKEWIANLESEERKRTGIGSLKVKFNSVFGYYIEITKSNLSSVPENYIRKQTTVNAERFITPELQKYEEIVLRGQEEINKYEYEVFLKTIEYVLGFTVKLQNLATNIATIDCLTSFATVALRERYVKPTLTSSGEIDIQDGRHPVVEQIREQSFVPNNTLLNEGENQLLLITGPNMAGKSVYMRQVALIVLMAHIGSFVPAKRASISLVDRIFVRSGASDSIGRGMSTFMVEMVETSYILHHATKNSLIIMDEIGRGTSTYDGISIAWAIAEYVVTNPDHAAKTLFATHYHELQQLESHYPEKIKNYHMAIEETSGNPVFLYRLTRGGAHGSYAIAVAKLAGIPHSVAQRAEELLEKFEKEKKISP